MEKTKTEEIKKNNSGVYIVLTYRYVPSYQRHALAVCSVPIGTRLEGCHSEVDKNKSYLLALF